VPHRGAGKAPAASRDRRDALPAGTWRAGVSVHGRFGEGGTPRGGLGTRTGPV